MSGPLTIGDIEVHPAANLFPEMGDGDLDALYESVKVHGVRVPLVFFEGKLIDGRNRLRASVMAGLDTRKLPRRSLGSDVDPFLWAWDANCSRLDYTPAQKAAIRIKIEEASGDLARMRAEIAESANRARAEKAKEQHEVSNPRAGERSTGRVSRETAPEPKRERARIAESAHVSPATVARVQKLKREDPEAFEALASGKPQRGKLPPDHPLLSKRKPAKNWSVPRSIPAMAAFLRERLPSDERSELARLLEDA